MAINLSNLSNVQHCIVVHPRSSTPAVVGEAHVVHGVGEPARRLSAVQWAKEVEWEDALLGVGTRVRQLRKSVSLELHQVLCKRQCRASLQYHHLPFLLLFLYTRLLRRGFHYQFWSFKEKKKKTINQVLGHFACELFGTWENFLWLYPCVRMKFKVTTHTTSLRKSLPFFEWSFLIGPISVHYSTCSIDFESHDTHHFFFIGPMDSRRGRWRGSALRGLFPEWNGVVGIFYNTDFAFCKEMYQNICAKSILSQKE